MLGRYRMYRGARAADDPLPNGSRQDTRKHTGHVLRPDAGEVRAFLDRPDAAAWGRFAASYRALLDSRFAADRRPFVAIVELARRGDVWLGCSCPTSKNSDVRRCHTFLALEFLAARFPDLDVHFPVHEHD